MDGKPRGVEVRRDNLACEMEGNGGRDPREGVLRKGFCFRLDLRMFRG